MQMEPFDIGKRIGDKAVLAVPMPGSGAGAFSFVYTLPLSDDDWAEIARAGRLPSEARVYVEEALWLFGISDVRPAAEARKQFQAARKLASSLGGLLEQLPDHGLAIVTLMLSLKNRRAFEGAVDPAAARNELKSQIDSLQRTTDWLENAEWRMRRSHSRATTKSRRIQLLVGALDRIVERFTGEHLVRSDKTGRRGRSFVKAVCKVADQSIRAGSIDDAMKRYIKVRLGRIAVPK